MATELVFAISLVKDEADIIEATVRRMARHVDGMIVADNGSTDGTREILDNLARELPLEVVNDCDPAHYQSRKMSALAAEAASRGVAWVVPFDADEVWYPRRGGSLAGALRRLPPEVLLAEATLFDHIATAADPDADPVSAIGWRRVSPVPMRKVACRTSPGLTIHDGNHAASYSEARFAPAVLDYLTVRHFPYRSPAQFASKVRNGAAALAATDLPRDVGQHWRDYGRLLDAHGPGVLGEVFREHFWSVDPAHDAGLVFDPAP